MYDDEAPNPMVSNRSKYYKVAKFPTKNIKTPIVLVYGGSDSLVDIEVMLKELPRHTIAKEIPHYEHLDFLWANSVDQLVFPHVFDALTEYAHADNNMETRKETYFRPHVARIHNRFIDSGVFSSADDDDAGDESSSAPAVLRHRKRSHSHRSMSNADPHTPPGPRHQSPSAQLAKLPHPPIPYAAAVSEVDPVDAPANGSTTFPPAPPKVPIRTNADSPTSSRITADSHAQSQSSSSRPEAWWSSDEVVGTGHSECSTPITLEQCTSQPSPDSQMSGMSIMFHSHSHGMNPGVARAVSGVAGSVVRGEGVGGGMDGELVNGKARTKEKKKGELALPVKVRD
jgi:lysosomal acid lipase/cholesteryl ester hydrolase